MRGPPPPAVKCAGKVLPANYMTVTLSSFFQVSNRADITDSKKFIHITKYNNYRIDISVLDTQY